MQGVVDDGRTLVIRLYSNAGAGLATEYWLSVTGIVAPPSPGRSGPVSVTVSERGSTMPAMEGTTQEGLVVYPVIDVDLAVSSNIARARVVRNPPFPPESVLGSEPQLLTDAPPNHPLPLPSPSPSC